MSAAHVDWPPFAPPEAWEEETLRARRDRAVAMPAAGKATAATVRIVIRRAVDVAAELPLASWALRPYIERNAITILYGDYGTYKSFVVIDWALRIALGRAALGFEWAPEPGPVVLVSAEGRGLSARLRGWCIRNRPGEKFDDVLREAELYCIEHPVNLSSVENAEALVDSINALGIKPVAVFIDTMSRNSDGNVEKSTSDAAAYLAVIDQHLRIVYQCAVILVHHVGHAEKGRVRGPIVLAANTDALIRIEKPNPAERRAALIVERLKDAEAPPPCALKADIIELGEVDKDGEPITTLALSETDMPVVPQKKDEPRGKAQRQLLAALRADGGPVWTIGEIREVGRKAGMVKSTARSAAEALTFSPWLTATIGGWKLADEDETGTRNRDERDETGTKGTSGT